MRNLDGSETKGDREVIAEYHTMRGAIGTRITKYTFPSGAISYSHTGKWGAGCRTNLEDMKSEIRVMLRWHPRHKVIKAI